MSAPAKADFYYECEVCKAKIPATYDNINPAGMQSIVVDKGGKTETTFRCEHHHQA